MTRSRLAAFVIDCKAADLDAATAFWSAALGRPAKPASESRYVDLVSPQGEPLLILQAVDHESRIHLDIETDDIPAEVARLERLGARQVGAVKDWIVMQAPTGHRFCLVPPQRPDFADVTAS